MTAVQPLLFHLKDRLQANYVDPANYTDADVLDLLNDAYAEACNQSMCLRTLATITIIPGQAEYQLPADFDQMYDVACGGALLEPMPYGEALEARVITGREDAYYIVANRIGIIPTPNGDTASTVLIHYAALPTPFASFESPLDPRFPPELADMLVHHVRWRVQMISGGAERIQNAKLDRGIFLNRIRDLVRSVGAEQKIAPPSFHLAAPRRSITRLIQTSTDNEDIS